MHVRIHVSITFSETVWFQLGNTQNDLEVTYAYEIARKLQIKQGMEPSRSFAVRTRLFRRPAPSPLAEAQ